MVINSAGEQPVSRVVSHHFNGSTGRWEKTDCISMVVLCGQDLAMEMN